jgi:UDP-glucose 4-epimerase
MGGNGFIGSHLVDSLGGAGHSVRVFDKHPEKFRPETPGVDYRYGSFDNPLDMAGVVDGMDAVVHLVSTTVPQTSNDDPAFDVRSNLLPTLALLDACVLKRVKRVVYLSSGGTVYGNPGSLPVAEDAPKEPYCSYGVTKLAVEKYLLYYEHQFGLSPRILRPSNVYGPRQDPAGIQGAPAVFLKRVGSGKKITVWGDGSVVRDYLYVEDLCRGILAALSDQSRHRIFNLGAGLGHSLSQLLQAVEKITGKKALVEYGAPREFDVKAVYLDVARAREHLDWRPAAGLEHGLSQTWKFLEKLP